MQASAHPISVCSICQLYVDSDWRLISTYSGLCFGVQWKKQCEMVLCTWLGYVLLNYLVVWKLHETYMYIWWGQLRNNFPDPSYVVLITSEHVYPWKNRTTNYITVYYLQVGFPFLTTSVSTKLWELYHLASAYANMDVRTLNVAKHRPRKHE